MFSIEEDIELRNEIVPKLSKDDLKKVYGDISNHGKTVWIAYAYGQIIGVWSTKCMAYNQVGTEYPIVPYILDGRDEGEFSILIDLESKLQNKPEVEQ